MHYHGALRSPLNHREMHLDIRRRLRYLQMYLHLRIRRNHTLRVIQPYHTTRGSMIGIWFDNIDWLGI